MLNKSKELNNMDKIQQLKQLRKEYNDLCKKCDDAESKVFAWDGFLLGQEKVDKMYCELNCLITKIYKLNRNIQAGGK